MAEINDEMAQQAEWRGRLVEAVLSRKFDDETLYQMLEAGLQQAHSEGLADAADLCQGIAKSAEKSSHRFVAFTLANSIRELDQLNRADFEQLASKLAQS